jgi:short-chain fatty acids transporter
VSLDGLARLLRSVIPDPFVIAMGLTFIALAAAALSGVVYGDRALGELVEAWVSGWVPPDAPAGSKPLGGLWSLLTFAMQMCLILVTGYVVASTRPVRWVLDRLARIPGDTRGAILLIAPVAMGLALINWGLGLIAGALLAREVGLALRARGVAVHYPLLAAAGYTGLAVWHGGLSGSAPLKVTQQANLEEVLGSVLAARIEVLSLFDTVLSPRNLVVTGLVMAVMVGVLLLLVPRREADFVQPPAPTAADEAEEEATPGFAGWIERSPVISVAFALLMAAWIVPWIADLGFLSLSPDSLNMVFLAVGLVLAGGPVRYMRLAREGAAACAGIIVQFPLYGGILGLLAAGGVIDRIADVLPASEAGLALTTFASAGLVNLFVPSGGGQWTVQGPMVMQAAATSGADPGRIVMALAWGDQWTNLFQPFWALPLLGITGTKAGDLLGPTFVLGIAAGVVFAVGAFVG